MFCDVVVGSEYVGVREGFRKGYAMSSRVTQTKCWVPGLLKGAQYNKNQQQNAPLRKAPHPCALCEWGWMRLLRSLASSAGGGSCINRECRQKWICTGFTGEPLSCIPESSYMDGPAETVWHMPLCMDEWTTVDLSELASRYVSRRVPTNSHACIFAVNNWSAYPRGHTSICVRLAAVAARPNISEGLC